MGVYLSDGHIRLHSGAFVLGVTDKEFRDTTAEAMKLAGAKVTLSEKPPNPSSWGKKLKYWIYEWSPYKVGLWLEGIFPEGKDHLPAVPDDLARDLVAGILDGDGSIQKRKKRWYQLQIYGSCRYLADLQRLFAANEVLMRYHPGKNYHSINFKSFVEAGFYFRMSRKQRLVAAYERDNGCDS